MLRAEPAGRPGGRYRVDPDVSQDTVHAVTAVEGFLADQLRRDDMSLAEIAAEVVSIARGQVMRTFTVTRGWRYEGYEGGTEDSTVLVDGQQIGGAYRAIGNPAQEAGWGHDDGGQARRLLDLLGAARPVLRAPHPGGEPSGPRSASTRPTPDLYDRLFDQERAEREAEAILAALARDHACTS